MRLILPASVGFLSFYTTNDRLLPFIRSNFNRRRAKGLWRARAPTKTAKSSVKLTEAAPLKFKHKRACSSSPSSSSWSWPFQVVMDASNYILIVPNWLETRATMNTTAMATATVTSMTIKMTRESLCWYVSLRVYVCVCVGLTCLLSLLDDRECEFR